MVLTIEEIRLRKKKYANRPEIKERTRLYMKQYRVKYKHDGRIKISKQEYRRRLKVKLVKYKGGKCEKCGYDDCIAALDFHHIKGEKLFSIGTGISNEFSILKLKKESDKCILLCSNCHRKLHYTTNCNPAVFVAPIEEVPAEMDY